MRYDFQESQGTSAQLEDLTPYPVILQSLELLDSTNPEYGPSFKLVWQLSTDEQDTLWDYVPALSKEGKPKLGIYNGKVSRLRQALNALAGKPPQERIAWFEEDGTIGYDDGTTLNVVGRPATIAGAAAINPDGTAGRFKVTSYRPRTGRVRAAATEATVAQQAAAAPVDFSQLGYAAAAAKAEQPVAAGADYGDEIPF